MDAIRNFAKCTVLAGYDQAALTIALSAGHGAKLPAPATEGDFHLVWWNATDYSDPSDDPNVEIVRCTARAADALTIERAQEGTVAQTHNTVGKTYRMILAMTKRIIDNLTPVGVDIREYGAKPGVDCTSLLQRINDYGKNIIFPADGNHYRIDNQVVLSPGVKIFGFSRHGTIRPSYGLADLGIGSIIDIPNAALSPFKYTSGNSFEGLTFYYPNQLRTAAVPTTYPATFTFNTLSAPWNVRWNNCQFVNSYAWIDAQCQHLDFRYENLEGCPISKGIITDGCGGTEVFRNIFGSYYYWCQSTDAAAAWILANSIGISIGYSDDYIMDNVFFGSINAGLKLFYGAVLPGGGYGTISNYSYDACNYGIYCESTHSIGVAINNLMGNAVVLDVEMAAGSTAAGNLQINGGKTWIDGAHTSMRMNRAASVLRVNNFEFFTTGIGVAAGAAGLLHLSNCRFSASSAPVDTSAATMTSLFLIGNNFNAAPNLHATPGTIYRASANSYLADASAGG